MSIGGHRNHSLIPFNLSIKLCLLRGGNKEYLALYNGVLLRSREETNYLQAESIGSGKILYIF